MDNLLINIFPSGSSQQRQRRARKMLSILKIFVLIFFYLHVFACAFYYIGVKRSFEEYGAELYRGESVKAYGWIAEKYSTY